MSLTSFGTYFGAGGQVQIVRGEKGQKGDSGVVLAQDPIEYTPGYQQVSIKMASETSKGAVSTAAQSFAGEKTFVNGLKASSIKHTGFNGVSGYVKANDQGVLTVDATDPATGVVIPAHTGLNGLDGGTYGDGGHTNLVPKVEISGVPTPAASGYKLGTIWIDKTNKDMWVCTDNTAGAAVWKKMSTYTLTDGSIALNHLNTSIYTNSGGDNKLVQTTANGDLFVKATRHINCDEILESTVNQGVLIDGVRMKDNNITSVVSSCTTCTVSGNETVGGTLGITGETTATGGVKTNTIAPIGSSLTLNGNTTLNGDLAASSITDNGTLSVSGATSVGGLTTATGGVKTNTITPIGTTVTLDGNMTVTGNTTLSGNVQMMVLKELKFANDQSAEEASKIIFYDTRGENANAWCGFGAFSYGLAGGFTMVSQVNYYDNPFCWFARHQTDAANMEMMRLRNKVLSVDSIQALAAATMDIKSPIKLSGYGSTGGYLYRSTDGTTSIQTPSGMEPSSTAATANYTVKRDASADIYANLIRGAGFKSTSTNVYLGYTGADAGYGSETLTCRIGTPDITKTHLYGIYSHLISYGDPRQVYIADGSVALNAYRVGYISSSRRFKHEIIDIGDRSNCIYNLRPVSFKYIGGSQEFTQYGLIAEEVHEVFPDMVRYGSDGLPETIQEKYLPFLMLNEMKKLKTENDELKAKVASMESDMTLIKQQLAALTQPSIKYVPAPTSVTNGEMIIYEGQNSHLFARWKTGGITKELDLINDTTA